MQESRKLIAFQSAWVVDDIEKAAMEWVKAASVGPFFIINYPEDMLVDTYYREQPSPITMITALTQVGDMQLKLVQPTGDHPSIFRDTVPAGHSAFHHISLWSKDVDADLDHYRQQGFEVAARGRIAGGAAFGFVDTHITLGHMTCLQEHTNESKGLYNMIKAIAANWDGKDPIRGYE
jgi:hypothetical protein